MTKTLDEVIKALDMCINDGDAQNCLGCPYGDYDGEAACYGNEREDALHYLKDMKNLEEDYDILYNKYWREFNQQQANPALTWYELKLMKGKPVWVEADDGKYKEWFIVGNFFSWFEKEDFDAHVNLYRYGSAMEMSKEMYGFYWQAYKKERK